MVLRFNCNRQKEPAERLLVLESAARWKASVSPSELGRLFALLGLRPFLQSR
jgi:hypothetical protein